MAVDELNTVEQVEAAMNTSGVSKTRKQKLKQRMKALQVCTDATRSDYTYQWQESAPDYVITWPFAGS